MMLSAAFLVLNLMMPFACSCGDWQLPPQPLTEPERREILHRLVQLESALAENRVFAAYIERETALAKKEQANSDEGIRLAGEATRLAQRETELERERADFYENAYKTLSKGRTKKCTLLKILTIGIARCN